MKNIHAGTMPGDRKVRVRVTDPHLVAEVILDAHKALALAAELIHAANAVLERELDERSA